MPKMRQPIYPRNKLRCSVKSLEMSSGENSVKNDLFEELLTSVKEAGKIHRGELQPTRVFIVNALDVQRIRQNLNLSQAQFAALVHVSVKTLRNWEQGARVPDGAAAALLTAIRNDPKNVISALNAGLEDSIVR